MAICCCIWPCPQLDALDFQLQDHRGSSAVSEVENTCSPLRLLLAEDNIVHSKVGFVGCRDAVHVFNIHETKGC